MYLKAGRAHPLIFPIFFSYYSHDRGAGALSTAAAGRCIAELRHALANDDRRLDYIETIPKRGFSNRALMSRSPGLWQIVGRVIPWVTLLFAVDTGAIQPLQA